jgi:multidrug efflux pump subunit AcrA (membrane-fusion protein)
MTANAPSQDLTYPKQRDADALNEPPLADHQPQRKRFRPRPWWIVPLALVPLAIGTGFMLNQSGEILAEETPLPVEVVTAQPVASYTIEREYVGEIVAGRSSSLGFEAGGTVVAILVDEGDAVTAGQPLAQLDTRSLQTQRQQLLAQKDQAAAVLQELQNGPRQQDIAAARAAVADLQQQVSLSRLQRERREDLYERGAISREELDQQTFGTGSLENRLAQAQSELDELLAGTRPEQIAAQAARVRQLEASIQALDVDMSKSVITAPFTGRVSQRLVDEGVVVSGGQAVVELIEGSTVEARIGIPADRVDSLPIGSSHSIQIGSSTYPATVTALLPELDSTSRTVTAVLTVDTEESLTIGQTARLSLNDTQPADGFWVPATALVQGERGLWSVYVASSLPQKTTPPGKSPAAM